MRSVKPLILVVDDNPQNLQVVASTLSEKGYELAITMSGFQALEYLNENCPELVLLDVSMPEMDGFEVCRKIKTIEKHKNLPIIFLSARTEINDILQGFEIGAVDYVSKPFNSLELLARIKLHLELKWAKEEIKTLQGIFPICSFCKNIRNDQGYWDKVDHYISKKTGAMFSHSICPECMKEHYSFVDDGEIK